MSPVATALGLLFAPAPGMPIDIALEALGSQAVFGPGCSDETTSKTIQAPARRSRDAPSLVRALGPEPLTVMAEFRSNTVYAVHLARLPVLDLTADQCRARLSMLPGGPITSGYNGPLHVYERPAGKVAGFTARYRAVLRTARGDCRIMLSIGD